MDDRQLLRRFVEENSQEAFAALTTRYLNLVYSVCRRELADAEAVEDVTQAVFLILARKAPTLRRGVVLSGWLFRTARFAAQNARTQAQRRAAYEQKAAEAMQQQSEGREDAAWAEIEPLLNRSLAALRDGERECVLLRFFQGLSFAEAGATLGLSEEAARKRVTRALEKMRRFFGKEGVIVPGVALAALLFAHAAKAVPATCSAGIATMTTGVLAGHLPLSLTGSHVYQLSEGVLKAMKIVHMKAAAGFATAVLLGVPATFAVGQSVAHKVKQSAALQAGRSASPQKATPQNLTPQNAMERYMARSGPAALEAYKTADRIQIESSDTKRLTDAEIATLDSYVNNPNMPVRLEVMVALRHAEPEHAKAAAAIARKGLTSQDSMTRLYALTTLDRLNAPDVVSVAKRMLSQRNQYVTPEAQKILKRRGADE